MDSDTTQTRSEYEQTRKRLADGTLLRAFRTNPPAGTRLRTDAELEETFNEAIRKHDPCEDLHVFGYGSLMWNPALDVAQTCVARVQGWHRRFCFRTVLGRGTPEQPGATLALDKGGACHGLLFRIEAAKVERELRLLWRREMIAGSYNARWISAYANGVKYRALSFVAIRSHERYIGSRPIEEIARLIRTGKGILGTSRDYFECTLGALDRFGIYDQGIERLRRAVVRADHDDRAA